MKKLHLNNKQFDRVSQTPSLLKINLFALLMLFFSLGNAKTVPNITNNDNILNDDIIQSGIVFPANWTGGNSVIACGGWDTTDEGYPAPSYTGVPSDPQCDRISFVFTDVNVDHCSGNAYELERHWTVIDSCEQNNEMTHVQLLSIADIVDPVCSVPSDMVIEVTQYECLVDIPIDGASLVVDDCSAWDYTVGYRLSADPNEALTPANGNSIDGFIVEDIPSNEDTIWIVYIVTDLCDNSDSCLTRVQIENSNNFISIDGPRVTCVNTTESYSVVNIPDATYRWSLLAGGTFSGVANSSNVEVEWGGAPGPGYELSVTMTTVDGCMFTDTINVLVGTAEGAITMTDDMNFSLGSTCAMTITPDMVAADPLPADGAFEIVLNDPQGNIIPDATVTADYVGMPIMVTLRNVCNGNNAMGTLYVFDKLGPIITCEDKELFCYELDQESGPVVVDNCGGDIILDRTDSTFTPLYCSDDFIGEISLTYTAYDQYNNASAPCTYIISVKRFPLDDIVGPADKSIAADTYMVCGEYETDENGNPSAAAAGIPTLNGLPIYPYTDEGCGVGVGYSDNVITSSSCFTKIMRTWTVAESWCTSGYVRTFPQLIEIKDTIPPVITCIESMTVSTNGYSCNGDVLLPALTVVDACTSTLNFDVEYPGGALIGQNGGLVSLPLGTSTVTYTVSDECYNYSTCSFDVLVEDNTNPVAVLYDSITVSLTDDGTAWVPGDRFDASSFDDCSPVTIEVMRMDEGANCGIVADTFSNAVHFCCSDVGTDVMIIVKVTDMSGNSNQGMVTVQVQDKTPPTITCPPDQSVECGYVFDLNDFSAFGNAVVIDACNDEVTENIEGFLNTCGVGYYERTFTAMGGTVSCTQIITVEPVSLFTYESINWPNDYFPTDICSDEDLDPQLLPEEFGYPTSTNQICQRVGFSYSDDKYTVSNACYKIIRKWVATDGCNEIPDTSYTYDQTIMVSNSVAPTIVSSCEAVQAFSDNCEGGDITLSSNATDDCTPLDNLYNTYKIDLFNDGVFDTTVVGTGASMEVTDSYPLGHHSIAWIYEDRCGNLTSCVQPFSIINNNMPTAYCHHDIVIAIQGMDTDGDGVNDTEMGCVTAEQFNANSSSECGYALQYSFSEDVNDNSLCVSCQDLGVYPISLYVTDENGNSSVCETTLQVQDNNDVDICERNCDLMVWPENNLEVSICNDDELLPATIGSQPVPGDGPCDEVVIEYVDELVIPYTDNCEYLIRSWTVTFGCGNEEVCEFEQTIIRTNYIAPSISCGDDITISTTGDNCTVPVDLLNPVVIASCHTGYVVTNSFNGNGANADDNYPVGTTEVVYTVTDDCGNIDVCSVNVIVNDDGNPNCSTQDITVTLGEDGTYTLQASEVDNGSADACGSVTTTVSPNTFGCDDAGTTVEVTLTVLDESGNESNCTANVTINDGSLPVARCVDPNTVTLYVGQNGQANVLASVIDNGSSTPCGSAVVTTSPTFVDCDDIADGATITLTATANGTQDQCETTVIVKDTIPPICVTQDITVNVGETIDKNLVDNGSTDNCTATENLDLFVFPSSFGCDAVGTTQTVTLMVTDQYLNTSICTANVTVVDNGAPICNAQDFTAYLDIDGNVTISASDIDNGSTQACGGGDVTLALDITTFDCTNVGPNTVVLTVSANGQSVTCDAVVTVSDTINPTCNVQTNVTVNAGEVFTANIINNNSTDACGIDTMWVEPNVFDCDQIGSQTVTLHVRDNNNNVYSCEASVTVVDNGAPICNAQDFTAYLDIDGNVTISASDIDNNSTAACGGGNVTLALDPSTFDCDNIGITNTVSLTVTANGQSSTCDAVVTVLDTIKPICSSKDTVVYLDENGYVAIDSSFVNDGSSDACGIQTIALSNYSFDCAYVGNNPVTLTVTDVNGNVSSCDATVQVLDTIGASCSTQNITRSLDDTGNVTITAEEIYTGSTSGGCGGTVTLGVNPSTFNCDNVGENIVTLNVSVNGNTSYCSAVVTITDDVNPVVICPDDFNNLTCDDYTNDYSFFGTATATDNCSIVTITENVEENLNTCNIGSVTRTFTATDGSGNTANCTQVLTFGLGDNTFSENDITWPTSPVTVEDCGDTDPSATGSVSVETQNADCAAVSVNYADVTTGSPCNGSILRTWTVVDTCQLDGVGAGIFIFNQEIILIDESAPLIVGPDDVIDTVSVPDCDGYVDLSNVTITDCHNYTVTNTSPYADDNNSADASGVYSEGITVYEIIATDECGNTSIDTVTVDITSEPTVFQCIKIHVDMTDNLSVTLFAEYFVTNEYGCEPLYYSYSNTDSVPLLTLTCDDVGPLTPVVIYGWTEDGGVLYDSCTAHFTLKDNNNYCGQNLTAGIEGVVFNSSLNTIQNVSVGIEGDLTARYLTNEDGGYAFDEVEELKNYNIIPFKDDDHMNGVSTLDLILIQRHILGLKKFETAQQVLAADINNNGVVNGADLINLRKLILGKTDSFTNNTSWRFVDANFDDWDMSTILNSDIPEEYIIEQLNTMMYVNWQGIKIGDVNNSAIANDLMDQSDVRYNETNILVVEDRLVAEGEEFVVDFKADNDQDFYGMQFTVSFNTDMVTYAGTDFSDIDFNESFVGDNYIDRGKLAISWNGLNKTELSKDDKVVSLKFVAKKDMRLSQCFSINSTILPAEWYDNETKDLKLIFNNVQDSEVQLISNIPNPWLDKTDINFFLPTDMDVVFSIYDVSGRLLLSKDNHYDQGLNTISVNESDISASGVLYYEIKTSNKKITKKMILLRK